MSRHRARKDNGPPDVVVLGVGNVLMQDDGLGVRALERLTTRYRLPPAVRVLDGGVLGLDLLPALDGVSALLVVDAVQADGPPGSLVHLEGDAVPRVLTLKTSIHQVGLCELLAVSRWQGTLPARLALFGVVPAQVDWGLELSPQVSAVLDELVDAVAGRLRGWGIVAEKIAQPVGGPQNARVSCPVYPTP